MKGQGTNAIAAFGAGFVAALVALIIEIEAFASVHILIPAMVNALNASSQSLPNSTNISAGASPKSIFGLALIIFAVIDAVQNFLSGFFGGIGFGLGFAFGDITILAFLGSLLAQVTPGVVGAMVVALVLVILGLIFHPKQS